MSFTNLPDLCILNLFARLSLLDLLTRVNLVCRRWNCFISLACSQRHSLQLFIGARLISTQLTYIPRYFCSKDDTIPLLYINGYHKSHLQICAINFRTIERLIGTFPRVTHLQIANDQLTDFVKYHLIELISRFGTKQLISLEVRFGALKRGSINGHISARQQQILRSIQPTAFPTLKSLTFVTECHFGANNIDLPILGQLVEFNFHIPNCIRVIYQSLAKYGRKIEQIGLSVGSAFCNLDKVYTELAQFVSASRIAQIGEYYTRFGDDGTVGYARKLYAICERLTGLTTVWVSLNPNLKYREVIRALVQLRELIHLGLDIKFKDQIEINSEEEKQTRLVSVKILSLNIISNEHSKDITTLDLPIRFPNLNRSYIRTTECKSCNQDNSLSSDTAYVHCVRHQLSVLKREIFNRKIRIFVYKRQRFRCAKKIRTYRLESAIFCVGTDDKKNSLALFYAVEGNVDDFDDHLCGEQCL